LIRAGYCVPTLLHGDGEEHVPVIGRPGRVQSRDVVSVDPVELEQGSLVLD